MAAEFPVSTLSERRLRHLVVAADARSQAHRAALSRGGHVLLFRRRRLRGAHPARSRHARRRSRERRHLQPAVHHARGRHGVLLPDSGDPIDSRQLPRAADDRRKGSRVSEAQPVQLVHLHGRRADGRVRAADRRPRYRLDDVRAAEHEVRDDESRAGRAGDLHHRLLVDPDRASTSSSRFTGCGRPG